MLGAAGCIVGYLWYKLGGSSEYRGGVVEMDAIVDTRGEEDKDDVKDVHALNGAVSVKELGKTATM
jgi:hypothetical protein